MTCVRPAIIVSDVPVLLLQSAFLLRAVYHLCRRWQSFPKNLQSTQRLRDSLLLSIVLLPNSFEISNTR